MRPARLVLALFSAVACGGDPATDPSPSPAADGAAVDVSAPEPGGGAAEAPGSGGAPALAFERLDASGDCAGLVPERVPEPIVIRRDAAGATCGAGLSDGGGAVALAAIGADGQTTYAVYGPDGAPRGAFVADPGLLAAEDGFRALVVTRPASGADPQVEHVAFGPDGEARRRELVSPDPAARTMFRWDLAADPAGGGVVVLRSTHVFGNHWSEVAAHRFDAGGAPRWPGGVAISSDESASEPLFLGAGVSTRGDVLVLAQDSAFLDVSWVDPGGHGVAAADRAERSDEVVGPGLSHAIDAVPLLDGSVAVRSGGQFRRAYAHLATASSPLPEWLATRAAWTFRFTRGNAGYAAMPPPGEASPDCAQRIDLVAPSGRLCGRAVLREEGASCTTRSVDQGWDGTVVQQSARDGCAYRVWPGLLSGG